MAKSKKKIGALSEDVGKLRRTVKKLAASQKALAQLVGKLARELDAKRGKKAKRKVEKKLAARRPAPAGEAPKKRPALVTAQPAAGRAEPVAAKG